MPHNLTVLRIHKFHVQVEGAADPRVGDHRGEDLRAVDLLALQRADCYTRHPSDWIVGLG